MRLQAVREAAQLVGLHALGAAARVDRRVGQAVAGTERGLRDARGEDLVPAGSGLHGHAGLGAVVVEVDGVLCDQGVGVADAPSRAGQRHRAAAPYRDGHRARGGHDCPRTVQTNGGSFAAALKTRMAAPSVTELE